MRKRHNKRIDRFLVVLVACAWGANVQAQWFDEVSEATGITGKGATFGAAWGDINADGMPDLWVGNHYRQPSLYVNQQYNRFAEKASSMWNGDPKADTHGAAWADFDNDGDQDLIELVGGAGGQGIGQNHLFVNSAGRLENQALQRGAAYPYGRGRTPLWLDINLDGRLDLLFANGPRPDRRGPTAILVQTDGQFADRNPVWESDSKSFSRTAKLLRLMKNALNAQFRMPTRVYGTNHFGQLSDFTGDRQLELMTFSPMQIIGSNQGRPTNITDQIQLPRLEGIADATIADFDGNGEMDIYFAKPGRQISELVVGSGNSFDSAGFEAFLVNYDDEDESQKTITFKSNGRITFQFSPEWVVSPQDIFIGREKVHPNGLTFELSQEEAEKPMGDDDSKMLGKGVQVYFRPIEAHWVLKSTADRVNLVVSSSEKIEFVEPSWRTPRPGVDSDSILFRRGEAYVEKALRHPTSAGKSCGAVVAGDFDNDMDSDVYVVCSGPVENAPNLLYENDGDGNFSLVANSGAEGSTLGVGDSAVTADFDGDGFLDIFVTNGAGGPPFHEDGPHQLFRNKGNENHWLEIDLTGNASNHDGIGAFVEVQAGTDTLIREQNGGFHCRAQNHMRMHFGLGRHNVIDRLLIHWPSGTLDICENVATNRILTVEEGECADGLLLSRVVDQ